MDSVSATHGSLPSTSPPLDVRANHDANAAAAHGSSREDPLNPSPSSAEVAAASTPSSPPTVHHVTGSAAHSSSGAVVVVVPPSVKVGDPSSSSAAPSPTGLPSTAATTPSRPSTPPPADLQPHHHSPSAPFASAGSATRSRTSSKTTALTALQPSALRFTCCRCRRCFLVTPGEHRSGATSTVRRATAPTCPLSSKSTRREDAAGTTEALSLPMQSPLQAVLQHSLDTCGTGRRFRPFTALCPTAATQDASCDGAGSGRVERSGISVGDASQRDLLTALSAYSFSSADVVTHKQLAELLTAAQNCMDSAANQQGDSAALRDARGGVGAFFANPDSLYEAWRVPSSSSGASSWKNRCWAEQQRQDGGRRGAAATASMRDAHPETTTVLGDLSELSAWGVKVHDSSTAQPECRSSDTRRTSSRTSHVDPRPTGDAITPGAAAHDERGEDADSQVTGSSPASLFLVDTLAMPSDEAAAAAAAAAEDDEDATQPGWSAARTATPGGGGQQGERPTLDRLMSGSGLATPPLHELPGPAMSRGSSVNNRTPGADAAHPRADTAAPVTFPSAPSYLPDCDVVCGATSAERRCPAKQRADTQSNAAASPAVSFEEQYRAWMRLLVHCTSPLPAQPLCMECWAGMVLQPLQQRTTKAMEGIETLHRAFAEATAEDRERLLVMSSAVPLMNSQRGEAAAAGDARLCEAPRPSSPAQATQLSLDAVASNIFGGAEEAWLESVHALSAPRSHGRVNIDTAREENAVCADRHTGASPLKTSNDVDWFPSQVKCAGDSPTEHEGIRQREAEVQTLLLELQEVESQQAKANAQLSDLRGVLAALDSAHDDCSSLIHVLRKDGTEGALAGTPVNIGVHRQQSVREVWAKLAAAHNTREVRAAFTTADEAAERQHAMRDLAARDAFIQHTSIDTFCFPLDVTGPMGTIAGLRLGLVAPYAGAASATAVRSSSAALAQHRSPTSTGRLYPAQPGRDSAPASLHKDPSRTAVSKGSGGDDGSCAGVEEAFFLEGFVRRQQQYAQLLLSGHTTSQAAALSTSNQNSSSGSSVADGKTGSPRSPASPAGSSGAVDGARVSVAEVNAACGYLLLLLNYLAQVNGFAFQGALLRPAGDRSTVAVLKRSPHRGHGNGRAAGAPVATPSTDTAASPFPFRFFSLFGSGAAAPTDGKKAAATPTTMATAAAGASAAAAAAVLRDRLRGIDGLATEALAGGSTSSWPAPRSSYVVDHEVDFYITDRLFAWRTFGAACVAVAACVRELADALHESLRCWRMRESLVLRRQVDAAGASAMPGTHADGAGCNKEAAEQDGFEPEGEAPTRSTAPQSLPQLVVSLSRQAHHRHTAGGTSSPITRQQAPAPASAAESPPNSNTSPGRAGPDGKEDRTGALIPSPAAPALTRFPLHPPFRIQNDTVDGFSVRHGSVTEAIWTLGMKKLLANVQWCVEATVELERLYAVSGESDGEEDDNEGQDLYRR